MTTKISKLTSWLVGILAGIAFILSYNALQGIALAAGLSWWLSLLWPLLVDFALVVFSLSVVRASLLNERPWWPWCLVAVSTIATIVFNLVHVSPGVDLQLIRWSVAVMPPVALFLSFESLMGMVKSGVRRQEYTEKIEDLALQRDKMQDTLDNLTGEIGHAQDKLTTLNGQVEDKREELADAGKRNVILIGDTDPTQMTPVQRQPYVKQAITLGFDEVEIAGVFDKSPKTIRRDIESTNGQNGSGR
jgi:hypothetical protein